jgi:hypothetical protein
MVNILNITDILPRGITPYNRRPAPPTLIVIHHSDTPIDTTPEAIANYHIYTKHWPGIGYHFLVYSTGRINQVNDIMTLSYHAGDDSDSPLNANWYSIGVCLVGDFSTKPPPLPQLAATRDLIAYLNLPFIPHKEAYNTVTKCPGDTWEQWRGSLRKEGTMSIGSYQFQGGAAGWAKQHVTASGAKMIKQINPDLVESWFGGDVIGRLWWNGEPDKQLVWSGGPGADAWWNLAHGRIASRPSIKLWEGPNEVAIDTVAKAQQFRDFELRRCAILHANGLKAVSGCTSTGCWEPWVYPYLFPVFNLTDYWEVHEYGMHAMTLDGNHLLRYRKVLAQLKQNSIRIPPFIIGETGIDFAGNPTTDGWKAQGLSPAQYAAQLNAYLLEVVKDPEVICVTPFTWSAQGWPSFDMTEDVSGLYTNYVKVLHPAPVDDLLAWAETIVIPINPNAGLFRYIYDKGWVPQSQEMTHDGVPYMWGFHSNLRTLCGWIGGRVQEVYTRPN